MYRECRNISSSLLLAAAILMALTAGDVVLSKGAAACTQDTAPAGNSAGQPESHEAASASPCPDRGAHSWTPVLVQLRKQKSYLDAKRFAARIKRHLGRGFTARKQQFARHQAQIERQRRASRRSKAHNKARQFAAARRHAHQHAHKHRQALGVRLKKFGYRKLRHIERPAALPNGSSVQNAFHWRSLWRHGARNDAQQQPSD